MTLYRGDSKKFDDYIKITINNIGIIDDIKEKYISIYSLTNIANIYIPITLYINRFNGELKYTLHKKEETFYGCLFKSFKLFDGFFKEIENRELIYYFDIFYKKYIKKYKRIDITNLNKEDISNISTYIPLVQQVC